MYFEVLAPRYLYIGYVFFCDACLCASRRLGAIASASPGVRSRCVWF